MAILDIQCADDLAALASEAVEQVRISKQYRDLIGAILMANHVADWYYLKTLKRKFNVEKEKMESHYPEWEILRQLANGIKHCKPRPHPHPEFDALPWENDGFWDSPGHSEGGGLHGFDWFVDFQGKQRSVIVLIETFLEKFKDHSSRPR